MRRRVLLLLNRAEILSITQPFVSPQQTDGLTPMSLNSRKYPFAASALQFTE
jgi:hypothetical protein